LPIERPHTRIAKSKLFLSLDVPPMAQDVARVEYYGLETEAVLAEGVIYVSDQVKLDVYPTDRQLAMWLQRAETHFAREGLDPVEDPESAIDVLAKYAPKRFAHLAPAVYRYFSDYRPIVPLIQSAQH